MTAEDSANKDTQPKDLVKFDLKQELQNCEQKRPWTMGHCARTLVKKPDLRMVLLAMDQGSMLKEHHADGAISVHVLKGAIRFSAQGESHDLREHGVVALGASIKHQVEALEASAILLTISWPDGEKLKAIEHRGY